MVTSKKLLNKENVQLAWFLIIVFIVFASFLIPYAYLENRKKFEFVDIKWVIEEYEFGKAYHGRFLAFGDSSLIYNIWLRNDPRENNVPTEGTFDKFKYGGTISFDKTIGECRGDVSRVVGDLGRFLNQGVGVGPVVSATTDVNLSNPPEKNYTDCITNPERTVIILESGEPSVVQSSENPFCYVIKISDCEDILGIEKFMIKTIDDFGDVRV